MTPPTTTRAATTRTSAWSSSISRPRPHVQDHVDRVHGTNFGGMTRGAHPPRLHPVQAPRALSPASLHDRIVCTFASGCRCTAPQVLPVRPRARRRLPRPPHEPRRTGPGSMYKTVRAATLAQLLLARPLPHYYLLSSICGQYGRGGTDCGSCCVVVSRC